MTLYLLRHPQPEIEPGICYGRLDIDLKPGALETVLAQLGTELPRGLPCLSSPARRCLRLAEAMLKDARVASLDSDPRLLEMDFGLWEGRPWDDIGEAAVGAWADDLLDGSAPGGECARQLIARVRALRDSLGQRDAVLVTHAGVIRTLLHLASERPAQEWRWDQPALGYGSLSRID